LQGYLRLGIGFDHIQHDLEAKAVLEREECSASVAVLSWHPQQALIADRGGQTDVVCSFD
jgi:hypothetical protein